MKHIADQFSFPFVGTGVQPAADAAQVAETRANDKLRAQGESDIPAATRAWFASIQAEGQWTSPNVLKRICISYAEGIY